MAEVQINPDSPIAKLGKPSDWTEEERRLRGNYRNQLHEMDEESAMRLLSEHWGLITCRRGAKVPCWAIVHAFWCSLHPKVLAYPD